MEKVENIHEIKILALSFFIGCIFSSQGQNDFFVHFYKGVPFIEQHDSIKPISKGSIIEKDAKLIINKKGLPTGVYHIFIQSNQKQKTQTFLITN